MPRTALPAAPTPPALLVLTLDAGVRGAAANAVRAVSDQVLATHADTVSAALTALDSATFDCVLVDVGSPCPADAETVRSVRGRAGGAATVLVIDDRSTVPEALDQAADLVLRETDLAGDWLRGLRRPVEHARLRASLRDAEASVGRLSDIVDSVADAVFTTTTDGRVVTWNDGAERLYGYPAAEMLGADFAVLHPPGSDEPARILAMARAGEAIHGLDTLLCTRDGLVGPVSINVSRLRTAHGTTTGLVVTARDLGDQHGLQAELVRQTMHDALTGLPNRSFLTFQLTQALAEAGQRHSPVAVLRLDLDHFRVANEVHGHLVGDGVLVQVADRLRALARPADIVGRVGGDEFVLVCPDTDLVAATLIAEQVIDSVGISFEGGHQTLRVGTSIGIAVSPPLKGDAETLLKHADTAMNDAKARGRGRSQAFDPKLARLASDEQRLAEDLRAALDCDGLEVHYQPVVDLATDRIIGIEALARWQHPDRGFVSPGTFVPLAETHGLAVTLDRWVLERACRETAAALRSGEVSPRLKVAVNLSARSLDGAGLVDVVGEVLDRTDLHPSTLVLEITETALLQNLDAARTSLAGLRALGVGISLDDFGTGYSSLSLLRDLPVTAVKIDRSFIRNIIEQPEDLAITEAIVRLANGLGLESIAEGIETAEQRDLVRGLGCARAQGFWWGPAVPMAALPGGRAAARVARILRTPVDSGPVLRGTRFSRRIGIHQNPDATPTVCCLRGGLGAGQGWLVITTPERREAFADSLGALHETALTHGHLVELDAYETLRRVTGPDGRVDPTRYDHVIGSVLRRLQASNSQVGVHAELGRVHRPLPSQWVSADLRARLEGAAALTLEYGDHPATCATHSSPAVAPLAATRSTVG